MTYRLPELTEATMSPEQRRVADTIKSGPRGLVQGPLLAWLQSPALADRAQALGAFCRFGTSLPAPAVRTRHHHHRRVLEGRFRMARGTPPIAIKAGLDPVAVEALRTGETPHFEQEDEQAVWRFAHHLLHDHEIPDATYRTVQDLLGPAATVELVAVLGYYGLISMTIKAFAVPLPNGEAEPF